MNRFYAGLAGFAKTCIGPILRVLQGPIILPDVDSANIQGTGIKYSGSYGTQVDG